MAESNNINLILNSFREGNNSHAFLVETNNIDRCLNDIKYICKYINCEHNCEEEEPCQICNLIDSENNPDLIIVRPLSKDSIEGRDIKTDQILDIIDVFSKKPLISKYSIYIIVGADKMNESAANKLLKFLEEPEGNIIGFLISEKPKNILSTIRSRCEYYHFKYDGDTILDLLNITQKEYDNYYKKALEFISKLNVEPKFVLMKDAKEISKMDRNEILNIFKVIYKIYLIKYENICHNLYNDNEYMKEINNYVLVNDINLVVKRIKLLDNSINDFQLNLNRDLFINNFIIRWE